MVNKKEISREDLASFMERLSSRPELFDQFSKILDLSDPSGAGAGLDINVMEGFLRPEIREAGRVAAKEFAEQTEARASEELKASGQVQQREKNLIFYTTYGAVSVTERIWRSRASSYIRVLPGLLGIGHRGYTLELQRAMTDFGLDHSFATATQKIAEHYGFDIPKSPFANTRLETQSASAHWRKFSANR
jgi:hypothetical protein